MDLKSAEKRWTAFLLSGLLLAAVPGMNVFSMENTAAESAENAEEKSESVSEETLPSDGKDESADDTAQASGIRREKEYLLEALDRLESMGLSPIKIWSEISGNQTVVQQLDGMKAAVAQTVSEKVQEAGDAAAEAAADAVQKETDKIQESLLQMIHERIQEFLENLFSGTEES